MEKYNLKHIQSLKHRKYRKKYNEFFIEGKRIISEALKNSASIKIIFFSTFFARRNSKFVDKVIQSGIPTEEIYDNKINSISQTKTPSGILAVCTIHIHTKFDFQTSNWLYLDHISDPGNLGTLFRTAAWFNIKNIALSSNSLDPYKPKVVRAAMGTHFNIKVHTQVDIDAFKNKGYYIIGADYGGTPISDKLKLPSRYVIVLGGETHGLSDKVMNSLDISLSIAKHGFGDSLNVSVAGALIIQMLANLR